VNTERGRLCIVATSIVQEDNPAAGTSITRAGIGEQRDIAHSSVISQGVPAVKIGPASVDGMALRSNTFGGGAKGQRARVSSETLGSGGGSRYRSS